jgi:pyruvate kinase
MTHREILLQFLLPIEEKMKSIGSDPRIQRVLPKHKLSATNLLKYLWLRTHNLSSYQEKLHAMGLSSLASAESHIHRQVQEVLQRLGHPQSEQQSDVCTAELASKVIKRNTRALFGPAANSGKPVLMVTMDSHSHDDIDMLAELIRRGMHIARINCAHDDAEVWSKVARKLQQAASIAGKGCKLYMDLAGPKFRVQVFKKGVPAKKLSVEAGDRIWLAESAEGKSGLKRLITCQIPGIVAQIKLQSKVMIDDGMIEALVEEKVEDTLALRIVRVSGKPWIKAEKGINFPQSSFRIPSLTREDLSAIEVVKEHADLVGYSFVRSVKDLEALENHLDLNQPELSPGLILKIETPEAVAQLPALLLHAMRYPRFGVMIARGDLAIEIGFERLSEIQEEILWICEAGHVPVIWATQVLEQMNKTGIASRAEMTDAFKAAQAECIMLNKGDHTLKVLDALQEIIARSQRHHQKKRYAMQALSIARKFKF